MPVMGALSECSFDEGGHLSTGDEIVGTVPVVGRRIAALGHSSSCQLVDVVLEGVAVIIDEQVTTTVVGVTQSPHQESRHLASRDEIVGTVPVVGRRIASFGDPLSCDPLDIELKNTPIIIGERAGWVTETERVGGC